MASSFSNNNFPFYFKELKDLFTSKLEVRFGVLKTVVTQLQSAVDLNEQNDALTQICNLAHRLASTAMTFGASYLGGLARKRVV